jgi:amino acid adenylation domain-containing protein
MKARNIEDMYKLSPIQQGMLFHSLSAPDTSVYFEQFSWTMLGQIDTDIFTRAWQLVMSQHATLRTAFFWEKLKEPLQVVQSDVQVPLQYHDWRDLAVTEQAARQEAFLQADRAHGFELSKAPLMRVALLHMADARYTVVWSYHHLLLDGWSVPLVLQGVLTTYDLLHQHKPVRLARTRPYRDYIMWLQGRDLAQAELFWRQKLQGFTMPTPFGIDQPIGSESGEAADFVKQEFQLEEAVSDSLQAFARQERLTINTLIQAAWAILLSRYSGETDIVFGTTVAGRPPGLAGSETMIGVFINSLPVRTKLGPQLTISEWLKQLQAQGAEIHQFEHSPLVQVQSWSDVPRGLPLFESLVVFENYPMNAFDSIQDLQGFQTTNYPLTLVAIPGRPFALRLIFDRRRFAGDSITRVFEHLQTTLRNIIANPQQRIADVSILPPAERHQVLVEWNTTDTAYDSATCLHTLFQAQVVRTPQAHAVTFEDQYLTYSELNQRANQLAHYLRSHGVRRETRVAICMERSLDLIVGLLGILKSGGTYVPLDPSYPAERLQFMLEDVQADILLTRSSLLTGLGVAARHVICLDSDRHLLDNQPVTNPSEDAEADNLAYIIYTSGSTGQPKGVQIVHRAVVNLVTWHQRSFNLTCHDRITQVANPAFDAMGWEVWPALLAGANILIPPNHVYMVPSHLQAWLDAHKITITFLPTPLAERILSLPWSVSSTLRIMLTGGDTLHQVPAGPVPFVLVNNYGPTEDTVVTTSGTIFTASTTPRAPSIGRPIANTQVYLLDRAMQPVPIGVAGEVYVGGAGIARGYLNRPALTAERFLPHPFGSERGARLYRTGDLARYLPNGEIEFLGRIDAQVKLRGLRIELGEIELLLGQHPGVREVVVQARDNHQGEKYLVAYVVEENQERAPAGQSGSQDEHSSGFAGHSPSMSPSYGSAELRRFLQKKLPNYMVPSVFMILDALPITPNGKLDRHALPVPDHSPSGDRESYIAPRTPTEQVVAEIWASILNLEHVGLHDNFFELGGHSLLLVQVHSQLCTALNRDISVTDLFKYPTISSLAEYLSLEPDKQIEPQPKPQRSEVRRDAIMQRRDLRQQHRPSKRYVGEQDGE